MTSINAVKLALEALENASPAAWASRVDSDTMKSIWRKHAEALEGLQVLLAELDNASCKSVQKRLEAQQPATGEPVAWPDEMLADTREVFDAGGSETPQVVRDVIEYVKSWVTVYSEKNHQAPAAQPAPSEPATTEPVAQWQKRHPVRTAGRWQNTDEHDAKWWHENAKGWEVRALYTRPAPSAAATGEPVARSEREQLRHAQAAVVMPMIGPLLDAWENSDREVMSQEPELSKQLKNINSAMEDADTRPAPSVPVTGEPVWCVATGERVNGEETYTHHDAYVPLADCFPLYTRPAPSVTDDVARNAERWRHAISDGGNQSMNFLDIFDDWDGDGDFVEVFDAAMLAAKERP